MRLLYFKSAVLFCILFISSFSVRATDYYVAQSGDDAANGSKTAPWKTIQHAADSVSAGDTVNIFPGIYRETVIINNSGSSNSPIVFRAENPTNRPIICGSEPASDFSWQDEGDGLFSTDISSLSNIPEMIYEKNIPLDFFDGYSISPKSSSSKISPTALLNIQKQKSRIGQSKLYGNITKTGGKLKAEARQVIALQTFLPMQFI